MIAAASPAAEGAVEEATGVFVGAGTPLDAGAAGAVRMDRRSCPGDGRRVNLSVTRWTLEPPLHIPKITRDSSQLSAVARRAPLADALKAFPHVTGVADYRRNIYSVSNREHPPVTAGILNRFRYLR